MSRKQSLPTLETHIRKAWLAEKGLESETLDVHSFRTPREGDHLCCDFEDCLYDEGCSIAQSVEVVAA